MAGAPPLSALDVEEQQARVRAAVATRAGGLPWRRSRLGAAAKRAVDLALGSAALGAALPLMAAVGVAVRATSPGPVVLRQQRVGLDGELFTMWKFRSMRAEQPDGLVQYRGEVTRSDPRLTPIGAALRDWRLDELPQLFHVVSGKMSLVGPRPDLPVNLAAYRDEDLIRFAMPPGCTAWTLTRGLFENDWATRQAINAEYVTQWSFWLDLKILAGTVGVMLRQQATAPKVSEVPGGPPATTRRS
ncbi:MAG: sugar transferase [Deltaproteobacteria bacterium]|nr:sugar transferase [Deltaproteobacteria bacterium]